MHISPKQVKFQHADSETQSSHGGTTDSGYWSEHRGPGPVDFQIQMTEEAMDLDRYFNAIQKKQSSDLTLETGAGFREQNEIHPLPITKRLPVKNPLNIISEDILGLNSAHEASTRGLLKLEAENHRPTYQVGLVPKSHELTISSPLKSGESPLLPISTEPEIDSEQETSEDESCASDDSYETCEHHEGVIRTILAGVEREILPIFARWLRTGELDVNGLLRTRSIETSSTSTGNRSSSDDARSSTTGSTSQGDSNKLKRKRGDQEDDHRNNGGFRRNDIPEQPKSSKRSNRKLACQFHKLYPGKYRRGSANGLKYKTCTNGFSDTKSLSYHLRTIHCGPKYFCKHCSEQFVDEATLDKHAKMPQPCKVHVDPEFAEERYIMTEERRKAYEKKAPLTPQEVRWFQVWDILFPSESRPESPYQHFDSVEQAIIQTADDIIPDQVEYQVRYFPGLDRADAERITRRVLDNFRTLLWERLDVNGLAQNTIVAPAEVGNDVGRASNQGPFSTAPQPNVHPNTTNDAATQGDLVNAANIGCGGNSDTEHAISAKLLHEAHNGNAPTDHGVSQDLNHTETPNPTAVNLNWLINPQLVRTVHCGVLENVTAPEQPYLQVQYGLDTTRSPRDLETIRGMDWSALLAEVDPSTFGVMDCAKVLQS
ncbi:uncharacterized protein Z519_04437 [Cladophialophora bantiana CBS 173.52]|uniref:C2H2-type domain-containing protein n=1 Tax=Cladophialophora bantiana (strain ATCC 10958 / CBS 173.52 / CDC B-1940 / NIH 8579) TaxID=1442370 RepID=A0A0D2EX53_CLAB1|nr:uncharacterized protein Z519_04437 [Cladophialophora bantiana CBS 173.52]KIW94461.1 hypothetical protein Z519_04437 [Cladophialophora bantiana CBS 173.52]